MIVGLLAASILLQPVLAEETPLRIVATGIGADEAVWSLDGVEVARTRDAEATVVQATPGRHDLWVESEARGAWRVLARPEATVPGEARYVEGWSAVHEPPAKGAGVSWWVPGALGAAGLLCLVLPRSLLQGRRTRRRRAD